MLAESRCARHPEARRRTSFAAPGTFALALVLLAGSAYTSFSQTPSAAQIAKLVDTRYNHLESLEARYTERYQGMGMDRTESGTLLLRKPGRMRWSYDTPAGKVFVLNGKDAISYTPGDAEADRLPAKQLDDLRSPLRFLLGHTELARELDHLDLAPVGNGYSLTGTPKGMSQRIRYIALTVDRQGLIHTLQIEETNGARTVFNFTDIHENVPAPDNDFVFIPPPGVAIVNGTAPM